MTLFRSCNAGSLVFAGLLCLAGTLSAQAPAAPGKKDVVVPSAEDKHRALEADADRLVLLARQLRTELEHTRPDELSVKVLRDADEIDRLARSTRTRIH